MCLVSLDDPGLTVFPTHRLLAGLDGDSAGRRRSREAIRELFDVEEVAARPARPRRRGRASASSATSTRTSARPFRLRLRDPAALDAPAPRPPEAYRRLDAVILEELVLKGASG